MRKIHVLICLLIGLQFTSCIPYERLINFREDQEKFAVPEDIASLNEVTIQPNDRIQIQVSSLNSDAAEPFNDDLNVQGGGGGPNQQLLVGYLVDPDGYISYPRLGKIKMGGLTRFEAKEKMEELLEPYLQAPIVKIGIVNFRVTIFGEVGNSAVINVDNERISIVEAMAQAGLTPYSERGEIWIIREQDGKRVFGSVNLYSRDVFNSPYFYLKQNDVVYVQPTRDKVTSIRQPFLAVIPWVTSVISLGTLIYTVINN
ncbi:MAG: polysaccharide biosynthesis/export family protein [Bacteroidota bacterium]